MQAIRGDQFRSAAHFLAERKDIHHVESPPPRFLGNNPVKTRQAGADVASAGVVWSIRRDRKIWDVYDQKLFLVRQDRAHFIHEMRQSLTKSLGRDALHPIVYPDHE